jgi:hypothetical protein
VTRNRLLLGGAVLLLVVLGSSLLAGRGGGESRGSALSRGPGGWLAARRYLEARGARVNVLDRRLNLFEGTGVLVSIFPWQHGLSADAADHLESHLRRGGTLVLAYSGSGGNAAEMVAMEGLGLQLEEKRRAVLNPFRWRRFSREEWDLRPAAGLKGAPVRVWAPHWGPELPKNSAVLFRSPQGAPAIAVLERHRGTRGQLWLLPADTFANARLENPGNAALLETMLRRLGNQWTFDEYHHGLISGPAVETDDFGRTLDLILVHLGVLYLVALLTLSRRFGPAWDESTVVTGSAATFLLGLGAIHHRLGHHREAAARLLARTRELDHNLDLPQDLDRRAASAGPRELVELAREVAGLRALTPLTLSPQGRGEQESGDRP